MKEEDAVWIIYVKPRGRGNHKWCPVGDLYFFYIDEVADFAAKLTVKYPGNRYKIKKYVAEGK